MHFRKYTYVVFILVALISVSVASSHSETHSDEDVLRYNKDGKFRIVQFADLHFGNENVGDNKNTQVVMETILEAENPDLVIITGDAVSGWMYNKTPGWFADQWREVVAPMVKFGVRWAFTFGNHDDGADLSRAEIVKLDQTFPLSLTKAGPSDLHGVTNYLLSILKSDGSSNVTTNLWFLDTGDYKCMDVQLPDGTDGWDCLRPNQVEWYKNTALNMKAFSSDNSLPPALAFFHIPQEEYMLGWNWYESYGDRTDLIRCPAVNTGLFGAAKEIGDIQSMHCGHDHTNNYYTKHYGITMYYGAKTGYGCYFKKGWLHGARVLDLTESPFSRTTWIRYEDNSVVKESDQVLHKPVTADAQMTCGTLWKP